MTDNRKEAFEKELQYIRQCERQLQQDAMRGDMSWKKSLESRIPERVHVNLRGAFATAFAIIFENGVGVIEKTYSKESLKKEFAVTDKNVELKGGRSYLKRMRNKAARSDRFKTLFTAVEGVGLGILGIGLPDIVIFIGYILKGIYEVALKYGYDYEKPHERYLILKMMSASIQKRGNWLRADMEIDQMLEAMIIPSREDIEDQIGATADDFAMDMLVLKFIQGLPLVGAVGGLSNPYYYNKIMEYVRLKYHKRYLLEKMEVGVETDTEAETETIMGNEED